MVLFQEESLSFIGANWSQEKGKQAKKHLKLFAPGLFFYLPAFFEKKCYLLVLKLLCLSDYFLATARISNPGCRVAKWSTGG